MINTELNKAIEISSSAIPLPEAIPPRGWGKKGNLYIYIYNLLLFIHFKELYIYYYCCYYYYIKLKI